MRADLVDSTLAMLYRKDARFRYLNRDHVLCKPLHALQRAIFTLHLQCLIDTNDPTVSQLLDDACREL